jgi:hypothetical protein
MEFEIRTHKYTNTHMNQTYTKINHQNPHKVARNQFDNFLNSLAILKTH